MTHQQRVVFNGFLDDVQAKLGKVEQGMPVADLYFGLMDKISYESFKKLVAILVVTERCHLDGERLFAQPMATQV